MIGKARVVAFLFAAVLTMSLFGIVARGATQEEMTGMYGGNFVVAVKDTTLDLNPATATDEASWRIIDLLYDSLGRMSPTSLEVVPWVAKDWTVNAETGKITVTLRDDVLWHSGEAVTADDVEYTYEDFYGYGPIATVDSPTQITFDFSAGGGGRFMTYGLTRPLVKDGAVNPTEGCGPFENPTVGTDYVEIHYFEDYFNGRPYLDSVKFVVVSGIDEAANALINRTIDFIGWTLGPNDPTDKRYNDTTIMDQAHTRVVFNPGLTYLYIGFKLSAATTLDSSDFRLAITSLINKDLFAAQEPYTVISDSPMSSKNLPWYNYSLKKYNAGFFFDPDGRKSTNYYPVTHILDVLGYFDRDNNGWREKPDGGQLSLRMLGPDMETDTRKATMAMGFQDLMKRVGLNTSLELNSTADPANFDIYLGVGQLGLEPSFIGSIPEIAQFNDDDINAALTSADNALDQAQRQVYVKQALGLISEKLPFAPVLHYKTIEAYDFTVYEGWVEMLGGINNFWSYIGLHKIATGSLGVSEITTVQSSLIGAKNTTDNTTLLTVKVVDQDGGFVEGANVELADSAGGIFESTTGQTNVLGVFETNYTAPEVAALTLSTIKATITKPTYAGTTAQTLVVIHPLWKFLVVEISRDSAVIDSGGNTRVTVTVRDQGGHFVAGAHLTLKLDQSGGHITGLSEISDGQFQATFSGNVTVDTSFKITAYATLDGYGPGIDETNIVVNRWGGSAPQAISTTESIPTLGIAFMVILVVLVVIFIRTTRREK